MISVIQNFICTKKSRLKLLKEQMPKMSKVFSDCEFFVNYNHTENLNEVHKLYKDNVDKLNFYNNLEQDWGAITLSMIKQTKTPYVLILCEDFEYRIDNTEFKKILKEVQKKNIGYMPLGRLWKYTRKEYINGYEQGNRLYYYKAKNSPGSSLSVDALYKKELFVEKLEELLQYNSRRFSKSLPHHYEDIFHEPNGVTNWGEDVLCAIPKEIIIMHEQTEREI
tara:strand:- start:17 stop:685 length:669 start_codon:yes stop_codon:yes gene_type:complete